MEVMQVRYTGIGAWKVSSVLAHLQFNKDTFPNKGWTQLSFLFGNFKSLKEAPVSWLEDMLNHDAVLFTVHLQNGQVLSIPLLNDNYDEIMEIIRGKDEKENMGE